MRGEVCVCVLIERGWRGEDGNLRCEEVWVPKSETETRMEMGGLDVD